MGGLRHRCYRGLASRIGAAGALLALLVAGTAHANPTGAPADTLNANLAALQSVVKDIQHLDATDGKRVSEERARYASEADMLRGAMDHLKDKYTRLGLAIDAHNARVEPLNNEVIEISRQIDIHNGHRANPQCAPCVSAYNAEARQLDAQQQGTQAQIELIDAEKTALGQRRADLDWYKGQLLAQRKTLSHDTLAWAARARAYIVKREALLLKADALHSQLASDESRMTDCVDRYASDEAMKHYCGNIQFDGESISIRQLRAIDIQFSSQIK